MQKILILLLSSLFLFSSCTKEKKSLTQEDKITIITTLFPLYDFAKEIAGEKASVSLLLPAGVEPHSFEPTPKDMVAIDKVDLFVCIGEDMEPWAADIIAGKRAKSTSVVDCNNIDELTTQKLQKPKDKHSASCDHAKKVEEKTEHKHSASCDHAKKVEEPKHEHSGACVHSKSGKDPHIWLNPQMAIVMVQRITEGLVRIDTLNRDYYEKRSEAFQQKLWFLDTKIDTTLAKCDNKKIIYGGHFAFGHFAKRYGLDYVSPYKGFSPNAEPTPKAIAKLIELTKATQTKTVFYEELVEPRVARIISEESGADMVMLHGLHNVASKNMLNSFSYLSVMEDNLKKLQKGLGCL